MTCSPKGMWQNPVPLSFPNRRLVCFCQLLMVASGISGAHAAALEGSSCGAHITPYSYKCETTKSLRSTGRICVCVCVCLYNKNPLPDVL